MKQAKTCGPFVWFTKPQFIYILSSFSLLLLIQFNIRMQIRQIKNLPHRFGQYGNETKNPEKTHLSHQKEQLISSFFLLFDHYFFAFILILCRKASLYSIYIYMYSIALIRIQKNTIAYYYTYIYSRSWAKIFFLYLKIAKSYYDFLYFHVNYSQSSEYLYRCYCYVFI